MASAVGFFFGNGSAPIDAVKLGLFTLKGLREKLLRSSGGEFIPPDMTGYPPAAKADSIARAKELETRYFEYTRVLRRLGRGTSIRLVELRTPHERLSAVDPETYRRLAVEWIEGAYPDYVANCDPLEEFMSNLELFRFGEVSNAIGAYFVNMDGMLRYMACELGRADFTTKKWVAKPIFTEMPPPYMGAPPPWDDGAAIWDSATIDVAGRPERRAAAWARRPRRVPLRVQPAWDPGGVSSGMPQASVRIGPIGPSHPRPRNLHIPQHIRWGDPPG